MLLLLSHTVCALCDVGVLASQVILSANKAPENEKD
jgi:hypothetical protein